MIVALIAVFAPVGVMAATYKSPVATTSNPRPTKPAPTTKPTATTKPETTTRPNGVQDDNDNNNGDGDGYGENGGGRPGEGVNGNGSSTTSPVTGDYTLFVLAAALVFGTGSIFAGRKLAKK